MKTRMSINARKGLTGVTTDMIEVFFAVVVVALLYASYVNGFFDIQFIVETNEVERHVVNTAQIMMGSRKLIYSDTVNGKERFYKGVFDKTKLDDIKSSGIESDITYPKSISSIEIKNLDNDDEWSLVVADRHMVGSYEFMGCVVEKFDTMGFIFSVASKAAKGVPDIESKFDYEDIQACWKTYAESKRGIFKKEFPALIRDGDSLSVARMKIMVSE